MSLTATAWTSADPLLRSMTRRMCEFMRPPQPTKPTLIRSFAPITRPRAAGRCCGDAWMPLPVAAAPATARAPPTCFMKSRRVVSSRFVMPASSVDCRHPNTKRRGWGTRSATVLHRAAQRAIDLPDRTEVIGQVGNAADHAVQLYRLRFTRRAEGVQPASGLRAKIRAERPPPLVGDPRLSPAGAPVSVLERVRAGTPPVHHRQ